MANTSKKSGKLLLVGIHKGKFVATFLPRDCKNITAKEHSFIEMLKSISLKMKRYPVRDTIEILNGYYYSTTRKRVQLCEEVKDKKGKVIVPGNIGEISLQQIYTELRIPEPEIAVEEVSQEIKEKIPA